MAGKTGRIWSMKILGQLAFLVLFMSTAIAAESEQYDIISIQAQRSMEVDNDLMYAALSVEIEGKDPSLLASKINTVMSWALSETKKSTAVNVMTGNYYVNPVYNKNEISHWRASQMLSLKSKDVTEMTRLIGVLQKRLLMKSMGFYISPQKRDDVENELIDEALDAFKKRANIVTSNLGAKGYRIVNIRINSPGAITSPQPMMGMAMESKIATPAVEPGMSNIAVAVSGSIQLQ